MTRQSVLFRGFGSFCVCVCLCEGDEDNILQEFVAVSSFFVVKKQKLEINFHLKYISEKWNRFSIFFVPSSVNIKYIKFLEFVSSCFTLLTFSHHITHRRQTHSHSSRIRLNLTKQNNFDLFFHFPESCSMKIGVDKANNHNNISCVHKIIFFVYF